MPNPCLKNCNDCKHGGECEGCLYNRERGLCEIAWCACNRGQMTCLTCKNCSFCQTLKNAPTMFELIRERAEAYARAEQRRREMAAVIQKWLKPLFVILIVGYVFGYYWHDFQPTESSVLPAVTAVTGALRAYCLIKLKAVNARYGTAAIFTMAHSLLIVLKAAFVLSDNAELIFLSVPTGIAASLAMMCSIWHEYNSHAEIVADYDNNLSESWGAVSKWHIGISVVTAVGVLLSMIPASLITVSIMVPSIMFSGIASIVIGILVLSYLKNTINIFK